MAIKKPPGGQSKGHMEKTTYSVKPHILKLYPFLGFRYKRNNLLICFCEWPKGFVGFLSRKEFLL